MKKKPTAASAAPDKTTESFEKPKSRKAAVPSKSSTPSSKETAGTEPVTGETKAPKRKTAASEKQQVTRSEAKPTTTKPRSKAADSKEKASASPTKSEPKPKITQTPVATPQLDSATPPPLFGRKKPDALKSLAELVEEEKLLPKPRKALASKKPAAEPEAPAKSTAESSIAPTRDAVNPPAKSRDRNRRAPRDAQNRTREVLEVGSLEGLATEKFEDLVVYWRDPQNRKEPTAPPARKGKEQGSPTGGKPVRQERRRPEREASYESTSIESFGEEELQVQFRRISDETPAKTRRRVERPAAIEPEPVPAAVVPSRPIIDIPVDAPQVVLRNGLPTLVRDKVVYPPIGFFGSAPDERRANIVLGEVRRAADAGIHIHSVLVEFEVSLAAVDSSFNYAAYMANRIVEIDPQAQVLLRIVFASPRDWEKQHPNAKYATLSGRVGEPSVCDNGFWEEASRSLAQFVERLRTLPIASNLLGVHLDRGEWFFPKGHGYDTSVAATQSFRDWLRTRYVGDVVAFRAAWFDGAVTFDSVQIPQFKASQEGSDFMRISRRERRWVDYHLFLSDATCSRIADLAYTAKSASQGYFLVGVSYGYTFEWSHPASGHLSLGKLLRTREIDFIAGPPSYRSREPGGDAPFPCPIDSLALNGKLYLSEEDFKTAIGDHREPDDYNPVIRTPQALESLHWRGAGAAVTHGSGMYWMDLWGNGWLNTETIWSRGASVFDTLVKRMASQPPDPDVAVFIDERALAYLVDEHSFALLVQDVRESVLRSGLSAGFYLLSDLAHRETFPECKLYIFLNAWDIRPEHRLAIKNRLQKDDKVLFWLYCAGMFDNGRESLERAREVTGIAIKPQPFHSRTGTTILSKRHPLCEAFAGQGLIGGANVDPSYFAIPEGAVVLGEYSQSGLPSFVIRDFNEDPDPSKHWKSVFLGEPYVTPGLLRALAQIAGCHIWNYHSDVSHVRPPFVAIHCSGTGQRAIALPRNWEAYDLLSSQWVTEDSNTVRFAGQDGTTHLFLVGDRNEIEPLINLDPQTMLRMETLPERPDVASHDAMTFDVPIMRLDEVFGDAPEEVGDEWFLKPGMIDLEEESPVVEQPADNKVVRRRRQRNGRKRDDARATSEAYDSELGMSVMFRKRE